MCKRYWKTISALTEENKSANEHDKKNNFQRNASVNNKSADENATKINDKNATEQKEKRAAKKVSAKDET